MTRNGTPRCALAGCPARAVVRVVMTWLVPPGHPEDTGGVGRKEAELCEPCCGEKRQEFTDRGDSFRMVARLPD